MHFLFLFMDGIGLGSNDPKINPLAKADMRNLQGLLSGHRLVIDSVPLESERASLLALDAQMGVPGPPQSATGQASLLTGRNVQQAIGVHYGPKPDQRVRHELAKGTLFSQLTEMGYTTALLNAYPKGYFSGINSGKRLYSAIPQAVTDAGVALKTAQDLYTGQAMAADFTGQGWRDHLNYTDSPLYTAWEAGDILGNLAASYDFAFFDYWASDYAGHRQDWEAATTLLETFDQVLGGLLATWDDSKGLILITSDHGNMEDLSTRRHTGNPVPALVIGDQVMRQRFGTGLQTLVDVAPAIMQFYADKN